MPPFDMRGAELGHHGAHCNFETILARCQLTGPVFDGLYEYYRRGLRLGREPA